MTGLADVLVTSIMAPTNWLVRLQPTGVSAITNGPLGETVNAPDDLESVMPDVTIAPENPAGETLKLPNGVLPVVIG